LSKENNVKNSVLSSKGVDDLIRTFKLINHETKLYLAGGGAYEKELKEIAKDEMENKIKFLGFLDKKELGKYLQEARLIVLPSKWYENFPYGALEASLYGKPVVASQIGGIPEIIEDGVTGLLFEPGNVEDLKEKIEKILSMDDEELIKMGEAGRKKVIQMYNKEKYYNEMIEIFENLLNSKKPKQLHPDQCH
jgi:glycosyltransferase involved in cell wall biosynthesis